MRRRILDRNVVVFGHIISEEGISVDPDKIEAIMNWLTPRNVTDVRYFVGLA